MARKRVWFSRQERRALRAAGYGRKDLTRLRRQILAGPLDWDAIDVRDLTIKEAVGLAIHQARTQSDG